MKFLLPLFFAVMILGVSSAYGYGEISTFDVKIVNSLGEEIKSPVVDQQLNLQTSLKNLSGKRVDWTYIVQIINSDGAIVDLKYAAGSLVKNQPLTAALSFTPHSSGT